MSSATWVRPPAVADLFYPGQKEALRATVDRLLNGARERKAKEDVLANIEIKSLVVPHAGYVYSGGVAARAYVELENLPKKRWKVFLLGPAHRVYVPYASVAAIQSYATPLGEVSISPVARSLALKAGFVPTAHEQEHALEVQLPFLQQVLPDFEIIPMVIGGADYKDLAQLITPHLDENSLLIISTDLSHFLSYKEAVAVDAVANKAVPALDHEAFLTYGNACGKTGVLTAMHIAQSRQWTGHFLDYCNSGDTGPDRSRVVGYGAYAMGIERVQREDIT